MMVGLIISSFFGNKSTPTPSYAPPTTAEFLILKAQSKTR
jgi:hypothetical protein